MKIQPTSQVSFGLNRSRQLRYVTPEIKREIDTIRFNNGKKLTITSEYHRSNLTNKLYYLKDAAGKWIKSKLDYFENGKVVKTLISKGD